MNKSVRLCVLFFAIFCLFTGILSAQPTIVQGRNIISGSGGNANGTITVVPNATFTATDSVVVSRTTVITITVTNGSFDQSLEPTPVGYWYVATWRLTNRPSYTATWVVPAIYPNVPLSRVELSASSTTPPYPSLFTGLQFGDVYTVGTGGVTQNLLVKLDASVPSRVVTVGSGECGVGVALSTVSAAGPVSVQWGGVATLVADNAVTAGHIITGGTSTVGRGRDTGQTTESGLPSGTCVIGYALTSASTGNTFSVQMRTGASGIGGSGYEPAITPGTTAQYWRGDKTWQTLSTGVLAAMSGLYESPLTFSSPFSRTVNNISLLLWGSGSRPVAANALGTPGNCMQWGAVGATDAGQPCGTGSGSGGSIYTTVTFSAAPTYPVSTSVVQTWKMTLTADMTTSPRATIDTTLAQAGQFFVWEYCQDGTGGRTVVWPLNVLNYGKVNPAANKCSKQTFVWTGSAAIAVTPMIAEGGAPALLTDNGALDLPTAPDTLLGRLSADTLHDKDIDTANGNALKIAGVAMTSNRGNGSAVQRAGVNSGTPGEVHCNDNSGTGNATTVGCPSLAVAGGRFTSASGTSVYFNPHDTQSYFMLEEFDPISTYSTTRYGLYGWVNSTIGTSGCGVTPAPTYQNAQTDHPGLVTFLTNTTVDTGCVASPDGNNLIRKFPSLANRNWELRTSWIPDAAQLTSNFILRIGVGNTYNSPSTQNSVHIRVEPAASPNIQYDLITAGAVTATYDSGVVYNPSSSYTFRQYGDTTAFYFSVSENGGLFSTDISLCPASCDMTASLPTFLTNVFTSLVHGPTNDSTYKRIYLDRVSFTLDGLTGR